MAGNPIFDAIERDILGARSEIGDWFHPHHSTSQAPAVMPVNVMTSPHEGETMQLATDLRAVADRLEPLEEEALTKLQAVSANPATAELFTILHQVSGLDLAPILGAVKTILQPYVPAA